MLRMLSVLAVLIASTAGLSACTSGFPAGDNSTPLHLSQPGYGY